MTITQSLRDDNAASGSITDAIDKLAIAMSGGFRSVSTRQNTDGTGRIVSQTLYTADGKGVSVKRSERNTGGGTKPGTGGNSISYDGELWVINAYGAAELDLDFTAEDDEKIIIDISSNGTEATVSEQIIIRNLLNGGMTIYQINTSGDFSFTGFVGESYRVTIATGGTGTANGVLVVRYVPEVGHAFSDVFQLGFPDIPSAFIDAVPKLLPPARVTTTGGGLSATTTMVFSFPDGLRPWWGGSESVRDVAIVVKYIGMVALPFSEFISATVQMNRYDSGIPALVAISDNVAAQATSGVWPAIVAYFNVDDEIMPYQPVRITLSFTHTIGLVVGEFAATLGYFIVRGTD